MSIIDVYKEILSGRRRCFPKHTWDYDNGGADNFKACMRYLILEKLKWTRNDLLEKVSSKLIADFKLRGGNYVVFGTTGAYRGLVYSFPEWNLKRWEFKNLAFDEWSEEDKREALKWLIEERLQWDYEDIIKNLTVQTFTDWNLRPFLSNFFKLSPYRAMIFLYPDKDWLPLKEEYQQKQRRIAKHVGQQMKGRACVNHLAKLTEDQVRLIRKIPFDGKTVTYPKVAKEFNVHRSVIADVHKRKTYRHVVDNE